jgi:hypothetical protein
LITDKQKSTTPKNEYNYINSSKIEKKITGENNDNNNYTVFEGGLIGI